MQAAMGVPSSTVSPVHCGCLLLLPVWFLVIPSIPSIHPTHPEQQLQVWASISVHFRGNVRGQCHAGGRGGPSSSLPLAFHKMCLSTC